MQLSALKYCSASALMVINIALLLRGGWGLIASPVAMLCLKTIIDELFGDTMEGDVPAPAAILDAMLVATLPLLTINSLLLACYFAPGDHTWIGDSLLRAGVDFDATRRNAGGLEIFSAISAVGILYSLGINIAHELTHRTTQPVLATAGRWLSAFCCESSFSLQHLSDHHMNVGYFEDPGTSRRGESVYAFVVRASIGNNRAAFRNERSRLQRRNLPFWTFQNRWLTGQSMTMALAAAHYVCGGWTAVGVFLLLGLIGRFLLESAAYVEHYGLVRVPGARFEPRHAWNSYRAISNAILFNVPRHADHHLYAGKPFYKLHTDDTAMHLPHGYVTMFALALIPPLFDRVMQPLLADWDLNRATEAERRYIVENGRKLWSPAPAE